MYNIWQMVWTLDAGDVDDGWMIWVQHKQNRHIMNGFGLSVWYLSWDDINPTGAATKLSHCLLVLCDHDHWPQAGQMIVVPHRCMVNTPTKGDQSCYSHIYDPITTTMGFGEYTQDWTHWITLSNLSRDTFAKGHKKSAQKYLSKNSTLMQLITPVRCGQVGLNEGAFLKPDPPHSLSWRVTEGFLFVVTLQRALLMKG